MWIANGWKEYEVIDCSRGEKLERFGAYLLARPDPQVIWSTERKRPEWKRLNARYHRSDKGGGSWEFFDLPEEWAIDYPPLSLRFRLKPFSFKHVGLFPEQAVNWEWFSSIIRDALEKEPDKEIRVLNLFAYTGGATLAAARAGAKVTHVDAAKGMVSWAKENAAASGLGDAPIRWLVDDCVKFVEREIRRGNSYDAILMDPPSYGRGPKGEIWKLEESIYPFLTSVARLLSPRPLFFLLNAYTTGLQPAALTYLLTETVGRANKDASVVSEEIGLKVMSTGSILPCGASGRVAFQRRSAG